MLLEGMYMIYNYVLFLLCICSGGINVIFSGRDLDVVPIILVIDIVDVDNTTNSADIVLTFNVVSITYCVLALCCLN